MLTISAPLEAGDLVLFPLFDGSIESGDGLAVGVTGVETVKSAP